MKKVCKLSGKDKALPMNTGAEAVETALKVARRWAYDVKGLEPDKAEIIAFNGNFHGRTMARQYLYHQKLSTNVVMVRY